MTSVRRVLKGFRIQGRSTQTLRISEETVAEVLVGNLANFWASSISMLISSSSTPRVR